jgi:hypothetical protein
MNIVAFSLFTLLILVLSYFCLFTLLALVHNFDYIRFVLFYFRLKILRLNLVYYLTIYIILQATYVLYKKIQILFLSRLVSFPIVNDKDDEISTSIEIYYISNTNTECIGLQSFAPNWYRDIKSKGDIEMIE